MMASETQSNGVIQLKMRLNAKVSLAVQLVDDYFINDLPEGEVKVYLKQIPSYPIKNLSGYYVFTDLPDGVYTVCVVSENYFYTERDVELNSLNPYEPLIRIILKPNIRYPFPASATLVRAIVRDRDENPVPGARVRSTLKTGFAARVSLKGAWEGEQSMDLVDIARMIHAGDTFLIIDEDETKREYCTVSQTPEGVTGVRSMSLVKPLEFSHGKGTQLMPVVETFTDEAGETAVYFRNTLSKKFEVLLEVLYGESRLERDVQITEGKSGSLGVIYL